VKQRIYFFRWGITREISFISRRTGSLPLAGAIEPLEVARPFVPFGAGRDAMLSSKRRFLVAGSEDRGPRLQTCRDI
jgi:hypothetical protein